jgi:hypothetical protein
MYEIYMVLCERAQNYVPLGYDRIWIRLRKRDQLDQGLIIKF